MLQIHVSDPGVCTVRDYWHGGQQEACYPFTKEDHLSNCEYLGPLAPLPNWDMVPSWVMREGEIEGVTLLDGSLDLVLQGHVFHLDPVGVDMKAARIKVTLCSKALYKLLNSK